MELLLSVKFHNSVLSFETIFKKLKKRFWPAFLTWMRVFLQLDNLTQNAFIERLNGKFRNQCLSQHWLKALDEAISEVDNWC